MKGSSIVVFAVTILGTMGGWLATAQSWQTISTPQAVGGLMLLLASTIGAAFGVQREPEA
jgi:hypothetical protein